MTKSFTFDGPDNYTARIRITTHRSIVLAATENINAWMKIFANHENEEQDSAIKANLSKCLEVIRLASICCADSVRVSCSADTTGIHVTFNFKFYFEQDLDTFKTRLCYMDDTND